MRILSLLLCVLTITFLQAQDIKIYPTPQSVKTNARTIVLDAPVFLNGAAEADTTAVEQLRLLLKSGAQKKSYTIYIGERNDRAVKKYDKFIPQVAGGYYLSIKPTRHELLARPVGSHDKYPCIGRGDLVNQRVQTLDRNRFAHYPADMRPRGTHTAHRDDLFRDGFGLVRRIRHGGRRLGQPLAHGIQQPVHVDGFRDEIDSTLLHSQNGAFRAAVMRQPYPRRGGSQRGIGLSAQQQVEMPVRIDGHAGNRVFGDFHRMALILQTLFQSIAHAARRIYYQYIGHSRRLKCYSKI